MATTSIAPISLPAICSRVTTPWSHTLIASLDNGFEIKHALLNGTLPFHNHPDNDEAFYLLSGTLNIQVLPEGQGGGSAEDMEKNQNIKDVNMKAGDLFLVKKGIFHRPVGEEAHVLIMEKEGIPGGNGKFAKDIEA